MLKEIEGLPVSYEIIDKKENPAETVIRKSGMVSEFTLGEMEVDLRLLAKQKDQLEAQAKIEEARCINIERTNPEIAAMSEEMRQVIFIYTKAFSFKKEADKKLAEIDELMKEYRSEVLKIAMETGLSLEQPKPDESANANG